MGLIGRLRDGLTRTRHAIVERFDDVVRQADAPDRRARSVDVGTLDALEELLLTADVGVTATRSVIAAVKGRSQNGKSLRDLVKEQIEAVFGATRVAIPPHAPPTVVLIVGVNGTGKTTTVGKLAHLLKRDVKVGDVVLSRGKIGAVGNTGQSTGAHLHFEVRQNGSPLNPVRFLRLPG